MHFAASIIVVLILISITTIDHILQVCKYKLMCQSNGELYSGFEREEQEWEFEKKKWILWIASGAMVMLFAFSQLYEYLGFSFETTILKNIYEIILLALILVSGICRIILWFKKFNKREEYLRLLIKNFPHGYIHDNSLHLHKHVRKIYLMNAITSLSLLSLIILLVGVVI